MNRFKKDLLRKGWYRFLLLQLLVIVTPLAAVPPDLTNGGIPGDTVSFNLGPTGARGWVYHVREDSSESRQILVMSVDAGSPADGILAPDDVILGADGTGAEPAPFNSDARKALAEAINEAEARSPATLKLLQWRAGTTTTVELPLQTMGSYSATAPYNCPKSALILKQGLQYLMANETAGRYSFGTLSLLATNDPSDPDNAARMARAASEARSLIPSAETMTQLMADERDASSMITWQRGHTLIVLAEYYLVTGDTDVLPAIEAYAVNIARNQSMFGTNGHIYAEKNPDGSDNGPMGGVYGTVNSAGLPCFLGLLLARECGLNHPGYQSTTEARVEAAIVRNSRFYAYYANKGAIPYGDHEPGRNSHENNGKSGLAALCFNLQASRIEEGGFFAKMATASATERERGHTGALFNYIWAPLGAATGGEEAAASHFRGIRWMLDLNRRWDGGFDYDCLNGEGPNSGSQYHNFRMSTAALLLYALPLRQLHLTGRAHDPARFLNSTDVTEAEFADGYSPISRSIEELITDLGSWSPMVQNRAAEALATRSLTSADVDTLTGLAVDPAGNSRTGACLALGKINHSATASSRAATLAGLLTDPENHVRFMAAEAMRYLPQTNKMEQIYAILSAADSTATPLFPIVEEDPLHFAHNKLAVLLFYSGNAYGPKGAIWGTGIDNIDRTYLYPAIRAIAANPIGFARSTLAKTYPNLTRADVDVLAETLVESVLFRAPADKMFGANVRQSGIETMQKYGIAEGVPLAMVYMVDDGRGSNYNKALGVLEAYAGSCTTVLPDPDVIGFCEALLSGGQAAAAQAVLDAIAADSSPTPVYPFKSIQSVTADAPTITLPANQTTLRANASDLANGDLVYTWRKVHGAGNVSYSPNGTAAAKDTTLKFDATPGKYLFKVNVSDSRGFTEVVDTVAVTLYDSDGSLPTNEAPAADPQSITTAPAISTPITLSGNDPEGYAIYFNVTSQPSHGTLTGTAPDLIYTAASSYLGPDSFSFEVMDSEGQTATATIDITVNTDGIETYIYEPFDEITGSNLNSPLQGGFGFVEPWAPAPYAPSHLITVYDENSFWDGVVDHVPTKPTTGARYISSAETPGFITARRKLSQSAGAMAGADKTLWASVVWKMSGYNYGRQIGFILGTDAISNRSQNVDTSGNYGAGLGHGIGVGGAINTLEVTPAIWDGGTLSARTSTGAAVVSTSLENLVVLKYVFADGAEPDRVYAYRFTEADTLSETDFNTNAIYVESVIDQNTLDILSFSQTNRGVEAIDEIRIGNSFASVIGLGSLPDETAPNLAPADIVDDRNGEPIVEATQVTYTLTFSEAMNSSTVDATDFVNLGNAAIQIGSITNPLPGVYAVPITPVSDGTLQLAVAAGASLNDEAGNPLDTTTAIADDTVITVNPAPTVVPDVIGQQQAEAESALSAAGLNTGNVAQQHDDLIPSGQVLSQTPSGGTEVPSGTVVDLTVSLGPDNGIHDAIADLPVSGTTTGSLGDTTTSDNLYQELLEDASTGRPDTRQSYLEYKWAFDLPPGDTLRFQIEAHHTANPENDNFVFAWSGNGVDGPYQDMLTVTKTGDDNQLQSFVLPTEVSGTVHVRVLDTDRSMGNSIQDSLYIDRMFFQVETTPASDYEVWESRHEGIDLSDPQADFDGDGLSNDDERIWGLDPGSAASHSPFSTLLRPDGTFHYTRRNPSLSGLNYTIWTSVDLSNWEEDSLATQEAGTTIDNDIQTISVRIDPALDGSPTRFVRVRAEAPAN